MTGVLTFADVHLKARQLSLETLGRERDPGALGTTTAELFYNLPEQAQEGVWRALRRGCDHPNNFLNEGFTGISAPGGEVRSLRPLGDDDPLRAIPLPVVFEILTGRVPRSGMVRCPLPDHDDWEPSCHVGDELFFCHGCRAGGSAIDLGAELYGIQPRGHGYFEIRRRLAGDLLGREAA